MKSYITYLRTTWQASLDAVPSKVTFNFALSTIQEYYSIRFTELSGAKINYNYLTLDRI